MDIVELYVIIDYFCKKFMPKYRKLLKNKDIISRNRAGILTASEIILIMLLFTQSGYKYFKFIGHILSTLLGYQLLCNKHKFKLGNLFLTSLA